MLTELNYIYNNVSKNAQEGFIKYKSMNELIADVMVLGNEKCKDGRLYEFVKEVIL